jgi:hypothetical protein
MKDLREVSYLLGMQITRDRTQRTLHIDEAHYIEDLVKTLGTGKTADVPTVGYDHLIKASVDKPTINCVHCWHVHKRCRTLSFQNWLTS